MPLLHELERSTSINLFKLHQTVKEILDEMKELSKRIDRIERHIESNLPIEDLNNW